MSGILISGNGSQVLDKLLKGGIFTCNIAGTFDSAVLNILYRPTSNSELISLGSRATDIITNTGFAFIAPFNAQIQIVTTNAGASTYIVATVISAQGTQ